MEADLSYFSVSRLQLAAKFPGPLAGLMRLFRNRPAAVAEFDDYSTHNGLPKFSDDAFRMTADLAFECAKIVVHLE